MRAYSILTTFILAYGLCNCQSHVETKVQTTSEQLPKPPVDSTQIKLQQLIALYPVKALPLKLSTTHIEADPEIKDSIASGIPIPSHLLDIFPKRLYSESGSDVFAVAKLTLLEERIGLLTRVPGVYVSSKIILFVLNSRTGHLESECEVAETFGDAGDSYVRTAEIRPLKNQDLLIKIEQSTCWPLDEELSKFRCIDSLLTYRLHNHKFSLLQKKKTRSY